MLMTYLETYNDPKELNNWMINFEEALKKIQERQKYDETWELIKKNYLKNKYE